jgi:hypothetical protein
VRRTWIVIPAEAGIQSFHELLDPRFRWGDEEGGFLNGLIANDLTRVAWGS